MILHTYLRLEILITKEPVILSLHKTSEFISTIRENSTIFVDDEGMICRKWKGREHFMGNLPCYQNGSSDTAALPHYFIETQGQ